MSIKQYEYQDVDRICIALGCSKPLGVSIIPENLESARSIEELMFGPESQTVRKLFLQEDIYYSDFDTHGLGRPERAERDFASWAGPVIFLGAAAWDNREYFISVVLNVLSNHIYDSFGFTKKEKLVSLSFVQEKPDGAYTRIDYSGPAEKLKDVGELLRNSTKKEPTVDDRGIDRQNSVLLI